ncbi:hypothetical protein KC333_g143 [Hortaea werneckii]|nr:hypothetical protein KC333_g143 [Hortaea werneckii]
MEDRRRSRCCSPTAPCTTCTSHQTNISTPNVGDQSRVASRRRRKGARRTGDVQATQLYLSTGSVANQQTRPNARTHALTHTRPLVLLFITVARRRGKGLTGWLQLKARAPVGDFQGISSPSSATIRKQVKGNVNTNLEAASIVYCRWSGVDLPDRGIADLISSAINQMSSPPLGRVHLRQPAGLHLSSSSPDTTAPIETSTARAGHPASIRGAGGYDGGRIIIVIAAPQRFE